MKHVAEPKYFWIVVKWWSLMAFPYLLNLSKASRTLEFLQRNLKICPTHLKEQAYKEIILPFLEYCASIWDAHHP